MKIEVTEKELNLLIDSIEVDEDIMIQMIREEKEKGHEPCDHCVSMLNLLNKLREIKNNM